MRRVSDIRLDRRGRDVAVVTATLRSPEFAHALRGVGQTGVFAVWTGVTIVLSLLAWLGAFGDTAHAFVRLCIASAVTLWIAHNANRWWQDHSRTTRDDLVVTCDPKRIRIDGPDANFLLQRNGNDVRFSSRPHVAGVQEERDERWLGHPIGYAYRDAWEIWIEAGLDVERVVAVWNEQDARAIVRYLTEANLLAAHGDDAAFEPNRREPA